jgi:lactoylglutathione lyase
MKFKQGTIAAGPISLNVSDLDVSEGFYQEVLGLRVVHEYLQFPFRHASMARDGKTLLTLWEQTYGRFKSPRRDSDYLAFETESAEELNRIARLLDNLGARWSEGVRLSEQSMPVSVRFKDPDGVVIEVFGPGSRKNLDSQKIDAKRTMWSIAAHSALRRIAGDACSSAAPNF